MKLISQFRNGARVRRKISYSDFATLARQKCAQYTLAGSAAILVDRAADTWQVVTIDDTVPNRIPNTTEESVT